MQVSLTVLANGSKNVNVYNSWVQALVGINNLDCIFKVLLLLSKVECIGLVFTQNRIRVKHTMTPYSVLSFLIDDVY